MIIDDYGILHYYTKSKGIGGIIKKFPEDFVVEEIGRNIITNINYSFLEKIKDLLVFKKDNYLHATLVKKNYSTEKIINALSKILRMSFNDIGYAGQKDKQALTSQRISLKKITAKQLKKIKLKNVFFKNLKYEPYAIRLGDLWGNKFTITIRNTTGNINEFITELPNFFGKQRFGEVRPNTHLIGKYLLRKEFEKAAQELLINTYPCEPEKWKKARKQIKEKWNNLKNIRLPDSLFIEKMFIKNFKGNYAQAFKKLPRRIVMLYINAYQSYLFNKTLSEKIIEGEHPEEIDLVGYKTVLKDKTLKRILTKEGVEPKNFKLKEINKISSKGKKRQAFMKIYEFKKISEKPLVITFKLKKGCYATIVLNELMKNAA